MHSAPMRDMKEYDTFFIFDESGDRGFLTAEPAPDSFGLIAGFIFPARNKSGFETRLKEIYAKLDTANMAKVRSSFAFVENRNAEVKEEYLRFFLESELLIVYEAMFLRGAYIMERLAEEMKERAKQGRRNTHIKVLTKEQKQDVYFEVLRGLMIKLDEICRTEENSSLAMLTDTVDKSILREARRSLNCLKRDEHISRVKAVDTEKGQRLEGSVVSTVDYPVAIKNIEMIDIADEPELTFAADFLANSIYRHLKGKIDKGCKLGLNSQKIMQDFTLVSKIALLNDNSMTDRLFSPNDLSED